MMTEEEKKLQEASVIYRNNGVGSKHDFVAGGKFIISLRRFAKLGEWQICPKCNGQGIVSKPSNIAGDVHQWTSTETAHICNVCDGRKVLERPLIK